MYGIKIDDDGHLVCPHCGGANLHQGKVEVFNCNEVDQNVLHVSVDGTSAQINRDIKGNPSPRNRNGLLIHFECETCPAKPVMEIFQHKGNTRLEIYYMGIGGHRYGY